ncbi:MAG: LysE family translocator [Candidatus Puniceispirillaceae bacterium]
METTNLLAVITFAMVTAFTPGPNNLMLAASGANFGFRRTVPHIAGITIGFMTVFLAAGAGLASLFAALPQLYDLLKILSVLFLIYLAWRIGSAGRVERRDRDRPLSFTQAALFQAVNPKGVSVIISTVSAYTSDAHSLASEISVLLIVFVLTTIGATTSWCLFGTAIARIFTTRRKLRMFNVTMAFLLILSLIPIIFN